MADTKFYPSLTTLIPLENMPVANLGFIQQGLDVIFKDLYFRDLQAQANPNGGGVFYSLTIVSYKRIALEVPGTDGLALILNPGIQNNLTTEVPISIGFSADILKYVTYTFDVFASIEENNSPRTPYAFVFYRCNERMILDTLYTPITVDTIIQDLAALQSPDADFNTDRWNDLVNGDIDNNGTQFREYTTGGYRFPNPNNPATKIPDPNNPSQLITPFVGYTTLGSIVPLLRIAIDSVFLPLTEQPVIYQYLKPGVKTSGKKPKYRNANGDLVTPVSPFANNYNPDVFDPFPMVTRYAIDPSSPNNILLNQGDFTTQGNEVYVRFTDYTLDGASTSIFFYYAVEMSNDSRFSPRSRITGPVRLVNSYPAESPGIKKSVTQLSNPVLNIPTAVLFELNEYIESERIKKFQIFRATNDKDALSVRTMALARTVNVEDDVIDDFSDVAFPLYGEPLFYRIVALREIENEQSTPSLPVFELVPSKPSNLVLTSIVDNINPPAPQLSYTSDPPTGSPIQLNNVVLNWPKTAHNATYHLYKMNNTGNWVKIYSIATNASTITIALANTDLQNGTLFKQDNDLNTIYHRFRVQVVNSSGLLNLTENELTI